MQSLLIIFCSLFLTQSEFSNDLSSDYFSNHEDIFQDIDKLPGHTFPEEVRNDIEFPVTLLHRHSHSHGYLVFSSDFSKSTYEKNVSGAYPCSWFLEKKDSEVKAYEFCKKETPYDGKEIKGRLEQLLDMGYQNYGTTLRPIVDGTVEYETNTGHVYELSEADANFNTTETAIIGHKEAACKPVIICIPAIGATMHHPLPDHAER